MRIPLTCQSREIVFTISDNILKMREKIEVLKAVVERVLKACNIPQANVKKIIEERNRETPDSKNGQNYETFDRNSDTDSSE